MQSLCKSVKPVINKNRPPCFLHNEGMASSCPLFLGPREGGHNNRYPVETGGLPSKACGFEQRPENQIPKEN